MALKIWRFPFRMVQYIFRWWSFRNLKVIINKTVIWDNSKERILWIIPTPWRLRYPSELTDQADVAIVDGVCQVVYVLPVGYPMSKQLEEHEFTHLLQAFREIPKKFAQKHPKLAQIWGGLKWQVKAIYYAIRYKYRGSPYEVEARLVAEGINATLVGAEKGCIQISCRCGYIFQSKTEWIVEGTKCGCCGTLYHSA